MSIDNEIEYRKDGWPLCPICGEDELWCRDVPANILGIVGCLCCDWESDNDWLERAAAGLQQGRKRGLRRE